MEESPDVADRIAAIAPYFLPAADVFKYGVDFYSNPVIGGVAELFFPLVQSLETSRWISFVLFIGMSSLTRNPNYPMFLRFNIQQALILDIALILVGLFGNLIPIPFLNDAIYVVTTAVLLYCIAFSALGKFPDQVPVLSDAAKMQIGPY